MASGPMPTMKSVRRSVNNGVDFNAAVSSTWIPPLSIIVERLNTLGTGVHDMKKPLTEAVQKVIIPSIQKNFEVGGRPSWQPLSDGTHEVRANMQDIDSSSILVKTGTLRSAMQDIHLWNITETEAVLGNLPDNIWYGYIHQGGFEGTGSGKKVSASGKTVLQIIQDRMKLDGQERHVPGIPERPFAVLQDEDEYEIMGIFEEWLGEEIEKAWP